MKIEYVEEGYIDSILMGSEKAYHFYKMVERGKAMMLQNQFLGRENDPSVKLYIKALDSKIEQAKKVALKFEHGK